MVAGDQRPESLVIEGPHAAEAHSRDADAVLVPAANRMPQILAAVWTEVACGDVSDE